MKFIYIVAMVAPTLIGLAQVAEARDPASSLGEGMANSEMHGTAQDIANHPEAFLAREEANDKAMKQRLDLIRQVVDIDEAKANQLVEINQKAESLNQAPVFDRDAVAKAKRQAEGERASLNKVADYTSYRMGLAHDLVKDLSKSKADGNLEKRTDFEDNDNAMLEHSMGVLRWTHAFDKDVVKKKFTWFDVGQDTSEIEPILKQLAVGATEVPKDAGLIHEIALNGACNKVKVPADQEFLAGFSKVYGTKDEVKIICEKGTRSFGPVEKDGKRYFKIGYTDARWPLRHVADSKEMVQGLRDMTKVPSRLNSRVEAGDRDSVETREPSGAEGAATSAR